MYNSNSTQILTSIARLTAFFALFLVSFSFQVNACDNVTNPGVISSNQMICQGESAATITGTDATGGSGDLIYTWMFKTDPSSPTYEVIPNSNVRDWDPGLLSQTTYYLRCANRVGCPLIETTTTIVEVVALPNAQITSSPATTAVNTAVDFTSQLVAGTTIAWTFEDGSPATSAVSNPSGITFSSIGTKTITLTLTNTNSPFCSRSVTITVEVTAALPVELVDFKALNTAKEQVSLSWKTLAETNHQYFAIERSEDGMHYQTIGRIEGDGLNSTDARHYTFDDLTPNKAQNYYRLMQVDMDGTTDYSEVKVVTMAAATPAIAVYPNPLKNTLNINMEYASEAAVQLYLYQATSGQLVQMLTLPASTTTHRLDIRNLPSGLYLLNIRNATGESLTQTKLMKTAE